MANSINWRNQTTFSTGDTIRVYQNIVESGKTRSQIFEGIVVRIRGHQGLKSFTVRKIASNAIGVEKIFPEATPSVTKIEVKKKGRVRRAVLGYLRSRIGRGATKIDDVFVKKQDLGNTNLVEAVSAPSVNKVEVGEKVRPAQTTKKTASAPVIKDKPKKIKKGPKKIVRKERLFVR